MLRIILKEGKAIQATEDMRLFVDEVVEELYPFIRDPLLIFSKTFPFYGREVEGPGGRIKNIAFKFHKVQSNWPADAQLGTLETEMGSLVLILYRLNKNGDPLLNAIHPRQILHELIHCFDPKIEKKILYKNIKNRTEQTTEEHYKDETEQDAYMRQDAIALANSLERLPLERVKQILNKKLELADKPVVSADERKIAWKTDPKMWRKFINTVYDEVVSRRIPKPQPTEFQKRLQATKS